MQVSTLAVAVDLDPRHKGKILRRGTQAGGFPGAFHPVMISNGKQADPLVPAKFHNFRDAKLPVVTVAGVDMQVSLDGVSLGIHVMRN
jgi:hypothetical protein